MSKVNTIIEQFKKYNTPFFSIYNGKDRVCINEGSNRNIRNLFEWS